ncbi:hypothetical protein RRF57_013133 [Xylaria bambusicola]|uniref:Uncharacterized protein n=1 Tax=Xylaria bambusicola TaxID=326684 RepID=A0AAN7UWC8_9PEZI
MVASSSPESISASAPPLGAGSGVTAFAVPFGESAAAVANEESVDKDERGDDVGGGVGVGVLVCRGISGDEGLEVASSSRRVQPLKALRKRFIVTP